MPRSTLVMTFVAMFAASPIFAAEEKGGEAVPFDKGMEEALPGATVQMPCGERTIAHVQLPNRNSMSFCLYNRGLRRGFWIFNEVASDDREFYLDKIAIRRPHDLKCAVDLFMAVTEADVPLPKALLEACPVEHRKRDDYNKRRIVRGGVFQETLGPTHHSHFCPAATGKAAFLLQVCSQLAAGCAPDETCKVLCADVIPSVGLAPADLWGSHQHTMSNPVNLGEEGNIAMEKNASCGGSTRVRAWARDDVGDPWGFPQIDFMLANGTSSWTGLIFHGTFFEPNFDFRMRGDSLPGATHRHGTVFVDE
jgi:hypothetical protein